MRRGNGMGSVIKVKGRNLRKPYKALITLGYTSEGNPKKKVIGYYRTVREGYAALDTYIKAPKAFELGKLTFKEVYNLWFEKYALKQNYKKKTIDGYKSLYNKHLSKFDNRIFREIKVLEWQSLFESIYSNSIERALKSRLNDIYKFAIKNEIVDKSQSYLLEVSKTPKKIIRKIFTREEINLLFSIKENRIAQALLILIYSGLRIEEFLHLTNKDVTNCINVRDSKTTAGLRIVPIHNKIKDLIEELKKENNEYLYTFKNTKANYSTFKYKFKNLMKELNMQHTIHDTRHTFATMLNNVDANSTSIIKLIGHSDFSITENVYTHKDLEELQKAIDLLN